MMGSKTRMQGKVSPERSATTPVYVGIDVCKDRLDVYIHPVGLKLEFANSPEGIKRLKRSLKTHQVALAAMEATGKFHRAAHRSLHADGFAVAIVNPLRSRLFAEALGALAKTDRGPRPTGGQDRPGRLPNAGDPLRKPQARRRRAAKQPHGDPPGARALPRRRGRRPDRSPQPARRDDGSAGDGRDQAPAPRG
jgi:transposase